jgi:hypothetical protein
MAAIRMHGLACFWLMAVLAALQQKHGKYCKSMQKKPKNTIFPQTDIFGLLRVHNPLPEPWFRNQL